jgi:cytochrome c5
MAHQQKKDPFVPVFFLIGAALLGATVFILVSNLLTTIERNSVKGAEDNSRQVAVANASLKPIGSVTTTADVPKGAVIAPAGGSGSADGEAVYKTTCFACHGTGAADAPMITKKEQWAPRVANGLSALMETALNGRGAMPARGGNPALSDAEIKAAILYMTTEAGFDLGGAEEPAKESTPAKTKEDVPAEKPTVTAPTKTNAEVSAEKPVPVAPAKIDEEVTTKKPVPTAPVKVNEEVADKKPVPTAPAKINEEVATKKSAPVMVIPAQTNAIENAPAKVEPVAPTKPVPVAEPQKPETPATPDTPPIPNAPVAPATKEVTAPKEATAKTETTPVASGGKTHEVKMLNMGKDGMMYLSLRL